LQHRGRVVDAQAVVSLDVGKQSCEVVGEWVIVSVIARVTAKFVCLQVYRMSVFECL
jgi:hypothetical protein